jgi:hypothetical protein
MVMNQTSDVERVAAVVSATIHKHWVLFLVEGIVRSFCLPSPRWQRR